MIATVTTEVRCKWCGAILFAVEGAAAVKLKIRCPSRRCRMWLDIVLD